MKISIYGVGRVGSTIAFTIVTNGLADELLLVNRTPAIAEGEAIDLSHAAAFVPHRVRVAAGALSDTAGSDVIVVTASVPFGSRHNTRLDMARGNLRLFEECIPKLAEASPEAILLIVTNPVDVMTWFALQFSGFPAARVIGSGTLLDSGRYRALLSEELGIHPDDIRAYILGEHGDTQFAALSVALSGGRRIDRSDAAERLFEQTVRSGYEIMQRKGHTNYAIAMAVRLMLESIVDDGRRTMPVCTRIENYQGVNDVCLSVPAVLGRGGITRIVLPALSEEEAAQFRRCATVVREAIEQCRVGI